MSLGRSGQKKHRARVAPGCQAEVELSSFFEPFVGEAGFFSKVVADDSEGLVDAGILTSRLDDQDVPVGEFKFDLVVLSHLKAVF